MHQSTHARCLELPALSAAEAYLAIPRGFRAKARSGASIPRPQPISSKCVTISAWAMPCSRSNP